MKSFFKRYCLLLIAISLVLSPVASAEAQTTTHKSKYSTSKKKRVKYSKRKKARYKKARALRRAAARAAAAKQRAIDLGENYDGSTIPNLASNKALIISQKTGEIQFAKNADTPTPIASITKLMTAMIVLDLQQPLDEVIYISGQDVDTYKGTRSRLPVGTGMTRADMLKLSLMSSENRAAFSLSSNYPGGRTAFVEAMNLKAKFIGLMNTRFVEPTGLSYQNVSTAEDLYRLVAIAHQYPEIREATTMQSYEVYLNDNNEKPVLFKNTNRLVRLGGWDIGLSKTGYISEAGRCLVMQTMLADEPMIVVLLDAAGSNKRTGDANRIRKWINYNNATNVMTLAESPILEPELMMSERIYETVQ